MSDETTTAMEVAADVYFAIVPEWLLDTATPRAIQVYGFLRRYADKHDGQAWPSRQTLAKRGKCSRKTVDRALSELVGLGAIKVTARLDKAGDQTTNLYQVYTTPLGGRDIDVATPIDIDDATGRDIDVAQNQSHVEPESDVVEEADKSATQSELAISNNTASIEEGRTRRNYQTAMKDALVAGMGWDTKDVTQAQWGRIEAAAKQLRDIEADPAEVPHRCQVYRVNFNGATMTPNAVATNWADLAEVRVQVSKRDIERASNKAAIRAALEGLE